MPLFDTGRLVITPSAAQAFGDDPAQAHVLLDRHAAGDWGDISESDRAANRAAVRSGKRILSGYRLASGGPKIWVITEEDRSVTTLVRISWARSRQEAERVHPGKNQADRKIVLPFLKGLWAIFYWIGSLAFGIWVLSMPLAGMTVLQLLIIAGFLFWLWGRLYDTRTDSK
jgi:hypothetical protein